MKTPAYSPISCSWYDRLEALATLNQECDVIYLDMQHHERRKFTGRILDIHTKNKEEFVVLGDKGAEVTIRLDYLIAVNDVSNPSYAFAEEEK